MSCDEVMDAMNRELDGDLTAEERQRMQHHLLNCPRCVLLYERLRRLSSQLESLPKVQPPYSVVDALLPRLEQMPLPTARKVRRRRMAWRRLILWTGGSVAVALLGVMAVVAEIHEGQLSAPQDGVVLETERADQAGEVPRSGAASPLASARRPSPEGLREQSGDPPSGRAEPSPRAGRTEGGGSALQAAFPFGGRGTAPSSAPEAKSTHEASRTPTSTPDVPSVPEAPTSEAPVDHEPNGEPPAPPPSDRATALVPPQQEESGAERAVALGGPAGSERPVANAGIPQGGKAKDVSKAPLPSPDGQWQAAVVGEGKARRVIVYDAKGAVRFRGHALSPIARVTLQWEGNALVYDVVTAQNGRETAERWRVDMAAMAEARLTQSPRP